MKINFLGSFETIQQGLRYERDDPTAEAKKTSATFGRLLEKAVVNKENDHQRSKRPVPSLNEVTPQEVMARLSVDLVQPPEIDIGMNEASLEPVIPQRVKESIASLAPPTIVSIKRYDSPSEFDRLPRQDRVAEVERLIISANQHQKAEIPVPLALAVVSTESSFKARSISQDGHATKGLFQFLDSTGREILSQLGSSGSYSPLNPEQNVTLGIRYLSQLNEIFSRPTQLNTGMQTFPGIDDLSRKNIALAAFNAGAGRVAEAQAHALEANLNPRDYDHIERFLPASTRDYVQKVLAREREFEHERGSRGQQEGEG